MKTAQPVPQDLTSSSDSSKKLLGGSHIALRLEAIATSKLQSFPSFATGVDRDRSNDEKIRVQATRVCCQLPLFPIPWDSVVPSQKVMGDTIM